jgi:hypothetical protein
MAKRAAKPPTVAAVPRADVPPVSPVKAPLRGKSFKDLVASQEPLIAATAKRLRELVLRVEPHATENIYGAGKTGIALYSVGAPTQVLCGIQPNRSSCLFYIHHVTESDAPELPLEGGGKNNRHLKFRAPPEVDARALAALLAIARSRIK